MEEVVVEEEEEVVVVEEEEGGLIMGDLELQRGTEMIGIEEDLLQEGEEMSLGDLRAGGTLEMMRAGGVVLQGDLQEAHMEVVVAVVVVVEGLGVGVEVEVELGVKRRQEVENSRFCSCALCC